MKKRAIVSLILTAIAVTLSGCSKFSAVNKKDFAKILSQNFAQNPYRLPDSTGITSYCTINLGSMPHEIRTPNSGIAQLVKKYDALKSAGLMTSEVVKEEEGTFFKQITTKYNISDKGKQIAKSSDNNSFTLPYCQVAFKEVQSFTEGSATEKAKLFSVKYTYVVEKVDDWVKHPKILEQYPDAKKIVDSVGQPREVKVLFMSTPEGLQLYGN